MSRNHLAGNQYRKGIGKFGTNADGEAVKLRQIRVPIHLVEDMKILTIALNNNDPRLTAIIKSWKD